MYRSTSGSAETKYFEIQNRQGQVEWIVDVHVFRLAEELCPKQNLSFLLQDDDRVELGPLVSLSWTSLGRLPDCDPTMPPPPAVK